MRIVGRRKEHPITFSASAALLAEGARFNDEIHRLPTGGTTFIPKGVFRFNTHEEANRHELDCLVESMAQCPGAFLMEQTLRDKDVADRIVLERALETFRGRSTC